MIKKLMSFFEGFTIWSTSFLRELANNIISLIFIVIVYMALWHFPQTIDLLLILNQADTLIFEVPLYFGSLMISAFLIWNVPKYNYFHNYKNITLRNFIGFVPNHHYLFQYQKEIIIYPYFVKIHMRKTIPRILAVALLAVSALSILNAMESFGLDNTYTEYLNPSNTLFLILIFLILLSEPRLYSKLGALIEKIPKTNYILLGISILLLLFILSLGTLNTQAEKDLGKLFLSNSALTVLLFTLCFNSYHFLKVFPRKLFYGGILIAGFLMVIFVFLLNFYPQLSYGINPLSVLIFSLLSLYMLSFLLVLIGKKIKLPLLTLVFLAGLFSSIFFANNSDHYQLRLVDTDVERPPLDKYVYRWIKSRRDHILNNETVFPVILVSAEGGGSRAGLWSFLIHSYLYEKSQGDYFKHHLLSLTGASGGGVGNSMFFSVAQKSSLEGITPNFKINGTGDYPELNYKASAIYKENYLSVALLSLLGRDLFKDVTGLFHFKNRGQLLEDQWMDSHHEQFATQTGHSLLQEEFLSFYQKRNTPNSLDSIAATPPLLIINTVHNQTGNYNMISPVTYDYLRPLVGMNDFLSDLQNSHPKKSIALSTAMRINASFPFITPVGDIRKELISGISKTDQYSDAGYYDNIGGRVSLGIEEVFHKVLSDSFPELAQKVKVKHLLIANEESLKIAKTETQLAAPLATLLNVRHGHTQKIIKQLGTLYAVRLKQTEIIPYKSNLSLINTKKAPQVIKPVLPIGRYLSTIAIRSMEARLMEVSKQLDSILEIN